MIKWKLQNRCDRFCAFISTVCKTLSHVQNSDCNADLAFLEKQLGVWDVQMESGQEKENF